MTQPQNTTQPTSTGVQRAKQITIAGTALTLVVFLVFAGVALTSFKGMMIALFVGFPIIAVLAVVTFIAQKVVQK
ncbi:MAG: hypothetical protein QM809_00680 [Gordonia sp. (in: high G+C Gram-positive bacteria)]|uniref:hypothetical protein n=1 Tax=Gordonia sp. (in: high G+C Gram-positive bacteria) TaxID=84139 RepID=UPI0039E6DE9D